MTTVSSSLKLFDAMSGPLKSITNAMNLTISTMQKMQNTSNQNVRVDRTLIAAKGQIASAETQINKAIEQATRSQNNFNESVKKSHKNTNELLSTVKGMAAAYLSIEGAKRLFESTVGAAMKQQSQIDTLAARTGNRAQGQDIFDQMAKQSLKYGQDVDAAMQGAQSFMSNTMDPKKLTQLNMLAMRLSKLNPTEGLEGAAFSLKELMSGDYTSIAERFNMSRSMLQNSTARKAGQKGDVDGFIKGMDELLNKQNMTQKAFETMLDSPAAKWSRIVETFKFKMATAGRDALSALEPLLNTLTIAFDSGSFDNFMTGLQNGLRITMQFLSTLVNSVMWLVNTISNGGPIVNGILTSIAVVITSLVIPAIWSAIASTAKLIGAWLVLNWPILLVAAAIGGLIALLVYFGVSAQQVVGVVVGVFYTLYASIYNYIALMWNIFASYAEFLINLFIDPVYAIKKLFYDLAKTFGDYMINMVQSAEDFGGGFVKVILGAVNKALDGFNWFVKKANEIFGTEFKTVGTIDAENVHLVSDGLKNLMSEMQEPTSTKNVVSIQRMEQKNLADSYNKGYTTGSNATDKALKSISGFVNGTKKNALQDAGKYNLGNSNTIPNVGKVGKVGKIEDKVDISSEDLKMMRDLAEMKSIQNFVTLQPKVQVTTGDIKSGADLDEIMDRIEKTLMEDVASAAAGYYS